MRSHEKYGEASSFVTSLAPNGTEQDNLWLKLADILSIWSNLEIVLKQNRIRICFAACIDVSELSIKRSLVSMSLLKQNPGCWHWAKILENNLPKMSAGARDFIGWILVWILIAC